MTNDLDDQLTRTLREHAGDAGTPRLDLDAVRGRARRIRRTRTALVGAGAAAVVLAVVAPLGLLGGGSSDRSVDPATSGTASAEIPAVQGESITIDLDALPTGVPAGVPYLLDDAIHLPGGATYTLEGEPGASLVGDVVPFGQGEWLATVAPGDGVYELRHLSADGDLVETVAGPEEGLTVGTTLAYDPATARVAWVEQPVDAAAAAGRLELVVADADGVEISRTDVPAGDGSVPSAAPLAFRGDDVVVTTGDSLATATLLMGLDGTVDELASELTDAVSPDGELAVRTSYSADGDCATVRRVEDDEPLGWSTTGCRSYGTFSTDSRMVLAGPSESQVAYNGNAESIIDAESGESIVEIGLPTGMQTFVYAGAWENARTLLVSVKQSVSDNAPARYGLVRIDVTTGRADLAAPIEEYDPLYDNGEARFYVR
ncbi:MAG: hypothetical protein PIR53_20430 [Nocardioides alkalitolerans]